MIGPVKVRGAALTAETSATSRNDSLSEYANSGLTSQSPPVPNPQKKNIRKMGKVLGFSRSMNRVLEAGEAIHGMLAPREDRISPMSEIEQTFEAIGQRIVRRRSVTSTMDVAWGLHERGAAHGTVVVAQEQVAGRGRFARRWVSAAGDSLLMSVLLRPTTDVAPLLGIAAALAVADAAATSGVVCSFKWPNDVLAGGRKVCGILLEARVSTDGRTAAVLGIGLNVGLRTADYPEIADVATSLREEARTAPDLGAVEAALITSLRGRYRQCADDGAAALADWARQLTTLGQQITVERREGTVSGTAESVDEIGRLILRLASGQRLTLSEGDVTLAGPA